MSVKAVKSNIGPLYQRLTAFPSQNIVIATCKGYFIKTTNQKCIYESPKMVKLNFSKKIVVNYVQEIFKHLQWKPSNHSCNIHISSAPQEHPKRTQTAPKQHPNSTTNSIPNSTQTAPKQHPNKQHSKLHQNSTQNSTP